MQNPKSKSIDETGDKDSDKKEKSSTPKRSQSLSGPATKTTDSSLQNTHSKKKGIMKVCTFNNIKLTSVIQY